MKRALLVAVFGLSLIGFFAFDLQRFMTLEALQQNQQNLVALKTQSPWAVAASFFALYVAATALSLPLATVLSLAAGALFGLVAGTLLVSFASSAGATLAFLASRFVLRDVVLRHFGDRLGAINDGVSKEGAMYLFILRLMPLFPFFLINLLMALTPMSARTFYWVSQVGMLAGTLVYVNAGTQLAQLEEPSDILSPGLIFSFALLGVFPIIAKKMAAWLQRHYA